MGNDSWTFAGGAIVVITLIVIGFLASWNMIGPSEVPTTTTTTTEPQDPNHNLVWSESTNKSLIYNITFSYSGPVEYLGITTGHWEKLNGAQINATYTSLPSIPCMLDFNSLLSLLGQAALDFHFLNGTDLLSGADQLQLMISKNTFPIGDWDFIASQFGTGWSYSTISQYSTYTTYTFDASNPSSVQFDYEWSQNASGHGAYVKKMYGTITKDTGIPTTVFYRYAFSHVAGYWYKITLTLNDIIS